MEYAAKIDREALKDRLKTTVDRHEQTIKDVCRIARNAIDRIIVLERKRNKKWVGLTDEEINSIDFPESGTATMRDFIRIIEAKLKEKNGV